MKTNLFSTRNIIIAIVLALIAFFAYNKYSQVKKLEAPVNVVTQADDHYVGPANAKVTVVEYADFQCPSCKAFEPIVTSVEAKYADRVKFVYRYFPLTQIHQNAMLSAIAAEAAGKQNKFWELKKVMFEKQEEWANSLDAEAKILGYAATLGIDVNKMKTDMATAEIKTRVERDMKEAVSIGLQGTPSFIINGQRITDLSKIASVEAFSAYLDAELAK
jgi:protein-disulfide isomerase